MRINYNALAMNNTNHFSKVNDRIAKSMSRLSSGYKITSPSDDAAGLAISKKLSAQIRGLDRAALNANDGVSIVQSAEGGMEEMHNILGRMRELAVQAANDVEDELDRDAIQEEIDSLAEELTQISETTAFNGQTLLNGNLSRRTLSSNSNIKTTSLSETVTIGVYELNVTADAKQAKYTTGFSYSGAVVTKEQAGILSVNDFQIEIAEGMSMTQVYEKLQASLAKINIDVYAGDKDTAFSSGSAVVFQTKEYGSDQQIHIRVSNPDLAALFGVTDDTTEKGTDCVASLVNTDEGFSATSVLTTKGNEITVTDRNGFNMVMEVLPEAVANEGVIKTSIEVLSAGTLVIQTGANEGEELPIEIPNLSAKALHVDELIMYTHDYANKAIESLDQAIAVVSSARSKLGAYQNRLEDVYDNLEIQSESVTEAYSRIMDTNMAEEMTEYTQQDVLAQAAISMMQKANERPESLLQLLQ
ncbi:MAG: flagellin [Wujia sp.]